MLSISAVRKKRLEKAVIGFNFLSNAYIYMLALRKRELELENARVRRWYVRPINVSRPLSSEFHSLVQDFYQFDEVQGHREYFRMDGHRLHDLYQRILANDVARKLIVRAKTHALTISAALRLSMTLKILASGDSVANTAKTYRIGKTTAFDILYDTCDAIWIALEKEFLRLPTEERWREIAQKFWERWNFALCLGAVDGRHVVVRKPPKAGSAYFNYKLDHSIVLLAVADGDYCYSYVDIGAYGRSHDGNVFAHSEFGKGLYEFHNPLNLPGQHLLPGSDVKCPHVFLGDDAFPLGGHLLKPYGGRNRSTEEQLFDYRLSRARGLVENTFGITVSRFRILQKPIGCEPEHVDKIVRATAVLHNYLRKTDGGAASDGRYMPPHMLDYVNEETGVMQEGSWRHDCPPDGALQNLSRGRFRSAYGKEVRDRFKNYFLTEEGSVPWQYRKFPSLRRSL